ncbi:MAG: TetR/AcrR family transcriptional regulator [Pseudomonadota bacterium]
MAINKDEARKAILEITSRLLAEGGLDAVRIREIAKEAGVSIGSVYNIFGDVDDLLRECNMRLLDELGTVGAAATAELQAKQVTDVRERLLALSRVYHEFVEDHAVAWNAMLSFNRAVAVRETPEWYLVRQEMLFDIITNVLRDTALADDEEQVTLAARALWSSVHGIVTNAYRGADDEALRANTWAQIDILVTTFVRGIDGHQTSGK